MRVIAVAVSMLMALASYLLAKEALAQYIPQHVPGSICFTQYVWCWAQPPGPVGSPCACPTMQGWTPGVRG